MGIQSLKPSASGFNLKDYTNIYCSVNATDPVYFTQNTWTTVLNVTGEGFMDMAYLRLGQSSSSTTSMKITVDGVVKYEASLGANTAGYFGVINPNWLNGSGGNWLVKGMSNAFPNTPIDYPYTAQGNRWCVIPDKIFFSSSIKIETYGGGTSPFYYKAYSIQTK